MLWIVLAVIVVLYFALGLKAVSELERHKDDRAEAFRQIYRR